MILAAIDFETTGLNLHIRTPLAGQPRAIEFAAVKVDEEGRELGEFAQLFDPSVPLSEEITKITGLTDADLDGAPSFRGAWPRIAEFLADVDVLAAHNMPFDAFILANELKRGGLRFRWPRHLVCTVELYEPLFGRRPRLIELYRDVLGSDYAQTHRALDDVRALVAILLADDVLSTLAQEREAAELPEEYAI